MRRGWVLLLLFWVVSAKAQEINPAWLKQVDACAQVESKKPTVLLIKQWHLSSGANTKNDKRMMQSYPQFKNQKNLFLQFEKWLKEKKFDTLLVEGCAGEINASFKPVFNGWGFDSLHAKSKEKAYSDILTHAGLKLEAEFGDQLRTVCADVEAEIKSGQLAMSDARGDSGYLARLVEYQDQPEKAKTYLEGTIEALKLPSNTTNAQAILALKKDIKTAFDRFMKSVEVRNAEAVKVLLAETAAHSGKKPIALLFGGLHAKGLKAELEKGKFNCKIFEPMGYESEDEALVEKLQKLLSTP